MSRIEHQRLVKELRKLGYEYTTSEGQSDFYECGRASITIRNGNGISDQDRKNVIREAMLKIGMDDPLARQNETPHS